MDLAKRMPAESPAICLRFLCLQTAIPTLAVSERVDTTGAGSTNLSLWTHRFGIKEHSALFLRRGRMLW
jgi:hypothetical protein